MPSRVYSGASTRTADGERCGLAVAVHDADHAVVGDVADDRPGDFPAFEQPGDVVLMALADDDEHPLLGL